MAATNVRNLLPEVICPYCWEAFAPHEVLFISSHETLRNDPRLGLNEMLRFRPSRFNLKGHAIDARGQECQALACPNCHLPLPEAFLTTQALFLSILGTPGCGKSFYLAGLTRHLQSQLHTRFGLHFTDPDPVLNRVLRGYVSNLFSHEHDTQPVALGSLIEKTELAGAGLYATVTFDNQEKRFPRPFLFVIRPGPTHPAKDPAMLSRVMCMYDNAGEHFQPGADNPQAPTTRHLARSQFLIFLFDPTQDPNFRQTYKNATGEQLISRNTDNQEAVLSEAASRVRRLRNLDPHEKHDRPLIVVLTKADAWRKLLRYDMDDPYDWDGKLATLDMAAVKKRSDALRGLMQQTCPEVVSTAESFCEHVFYWAASPLGEPPVFNGALKQYCLAPGPVKPLGVLPPVILGLYLSVPGLILDTRGNQGPPRPGRPVTPTPLGPKAGTPAPATLGPTGTKLETRPNNKRR